MVSTFFLYLVPVSEVLYFVHGTYIMMERNKCARKEQSLLLDLFKAFDKIKSCSNLIFSSKKSSKGSNIGFISGRLPSRVTVLSRIVHLYTVQPLLGYFVYTYISLHEKREVLFNIQRKK